MSSAAEQIKETPFRLEWIDPHSGTENPLNYRIHPSGQTAALESLIFGDDPVGWAGVALLNERRVEDGWEPQDAHPTFIDGHDRRKLAIKHKGLLPTIIGHWSPRQEARILRTLDPIAALAETDRTILDALLRTTEESDAAVAQMLSELAADNGLIPVDKEWGDTLGGLPSGDRQPFKQMTFTLSDAQAEQVEQAIRQAKDAGEFTNTGNENSNGNALARICEAYVG